MGRRARAEPLERLLVAGYARGMDDDLSEELKPCLPVSCPDEELGWITFAAHPLPMSTLLGVPEGERGVELPED